MKKHEIGDLNQLFTDGETADHEIFAEMRSNILLTDSQHYKKVEGKLWERLRETKTSEALKLKLVKNHIQVVTKTYKNQILAHAPGVHVLPYNPKELQDIKDAEISQAVWADAEEKLNYSEKIDRYADSFIVVGEVASKTYWNPNAGKLIGYRQAVDEFGQPKVDEAGEPVSDKGQPVFQGQLIQEPLHPFNIIRKKGVQSLEESPFLCVRNMLPIADVKAMVASIQDPKEREEKEKYIQEASDTTFKVFDSTSGEYRDAKDQVMLREFYFRPGCPEYPKGYYYITTEKGILFEGELPFGKFPIVVEGFDYMPTSPRARSIIKPLRGPQAEINRMASMRSTTQITLGQDMIIMKAGSKLSKGNNFAGVREFSVSGPDPMVVQGRSGDQFAASLQEEVTELYRLANMEYELQENQTQDPNLQLYKSLSQKKKYAMYVRKFERFLCKNAKLYLELAKHYLPDDYLIKAVGKREYVNLAEFRRIDDDGFNIKLKPMSEDVDSMFGKHLSIQAALQYASKDLPPGAKGRLLRAMPFIGEDNMFDELTITDENIESDILALDREEYRPANPSDEHAEYIKRLQHRMKQSDFKLLSPIAQGMYQQKLMEHQEAAAEQARQLKMAQSEFIPTGGALITCSVHIPDPAKPGQTKQLRLPYEALMHLVKLLESQGSSQEALEQMDQQSQLQVLQMAMNQPQQMQPALPQAAGDQMLPY